MEKKILDNIDMGMSWTTYIGSVHGVLKGAGLWDDSVEMLMGMTGMAFHFIVHRQTCPSSVTVYDWMSEHFAMMDRIGVYSESIHVENSGSLNSIFSKGFIKIAYPEKQNCIRMLCSCWIKL